jgi:hypothetical protein
MWQISHERQTPNLTARVILRALSTYPREILVGNAQQ